ncbi:MAG: magnesium/cobalt transporter CorA [Chitinophagaceae bacterium]|nr:magnesium/cobalt transporter CorA [Chitinophagaceae bacterium]
MKEIHKEPSADEKVILELISYTREQYERTNNIAIDDLLIKIDPDKVNWINMDGMGDLTIVEKLQAHFCFDALTLDDVINEQRPKAEEYDDYLFFTLKMLYRIEGDKIDYEQISFILGTNYLISFQEKEGDLFDAFRERIRLDQGKVRRMQADYLMYRLIDIIVDNYYTILDNIGTQIDEIEDCIYSDSAEEAFHKIQGIKKELIFLRKAVYPLREALSKVLKGETSFVQEENLRYFSDVYDHTVHVIDSLETYKDLTSSLLDIHMNTMNNRMNEVMKLLTVITTIFIPLSFIASVYGMNFEFMPELHSKWGYPIVLGFMVLVGAGMIYYFKRKKWF